MAIPVTPTNTCALLVGLMRNNATAESRKYISDMQMQINSAHRLASLVLANADALRLVLPDALNEILLLARSIAPDALITPPQMRENSSPHDPGTYTLVGSPAQTGEAGQGRFEACE